MAADSLILQVAPMEHVGRVANQEAAVTRPQLQQQLAAETLQRESQTVEKTEPQAAGQRARRREERPRDKQGGDESFDELLHRQAEGEEQEEPVTEEQAEEAAAAPSSVWAGNILNLKV